MTCTIVGWLPVFARPEAVDIILDSWRNLQREREFKLFGYVILESHIHLIASAPQLPSAMQSFKMRQKLYYMHQNPVKRGYVDDAVHWRYSSARGYEDLPGLIEVITDWM